jgi:anti-sigma regulatory factor (Ser/Thr protein kinase)
MATGTVRCPCQPSATGPGPITATFIRSFAGRPESARAARSWVAGFFAATDAADGAVLMASELFTNAVLHSASGLPGGLVIVKVRISDDAVRVDVVDQGEMPPGADAARGLGAGVAIVAQLADVFGADGPDRWFMVRAACSSAVPEAAERDDSDDGGLERG